MAAGSELHGTDTDAEAIAWCRDHLPARFGVNAELPPLDYEDSSFDLIYAISVFTHLTEELGLAWAQELARVLRPGGYALLTTLGARYRDGLTPKERARFDAGELVVRRPEAVGSNLCAAFHPRAYVQETLAGPGSLEPVEFVPEGATGNPHQDLHLLRKP